MADAHPYVENKAIPADHNGKRPCICGRARPNRLHASAAVAKVDDAHAEHLRRIGEHQ
ncbi:hypothetical protein OHB44_27900 [Micromonospora sp. NBC_00821]|uniref:hypothetical protein n=1 Tax=Micromonospora sp. NBC_00821 TaxID=2975977 RepID=UPI002ED5CA8E|nr:hypothetical protein OHB44_27900 [Micromonospora sp. NBC_00821]